MSHNCGASPTSLKVHYLITQFLYLAIYSCSFPVEFSGCSFVFANLLSCLVSGLRQQMVDCIYKNFGGSGNPGIVVGLESFISEIGVCKSSMRFCGV